MTGTGRAGVPLDGPWAFVPDPDYRYAPGGLPAGSLIPVPGSWEAAWAEPQGIVHAWYARSLAVPDDWPGGTLLLRFGGVMARATVFVDGRVVGAQDLGALPFEVEAGAVAPGTMHDLVVEVENPVNAVRRFPAFGDPAPEDATDSRASSYEAIPHGKQAWYTSTSGLLGAVVAERVPAPRIAALRVRPRPDQGAVAASWRLAGDRGGSRATMRLVIRSPDGRAVGDLAVDAGVGSAVLPIPDVELWDLWRPALYRLEATLEVEPVRDGDPASDTVVVRFGMRTVAVRDGAILLNGRSILLRGALDQDLWPLGRSNPSSRAALEAQVASAREMGLNLLRCHIKIPDPAYLDVADEAGILVWCELPSWRRWGAETGSMARRTLHGMVEAMGHHPSLVTWTIVNEDWGTDLRHSARDRRWLRATAEWLKAEDPGRLVVDNSACETPYGPNFHLRTDIADFHAYRSMPDGLARWRALLDELDAAPSWLWSPNGDAARTGDEAVVLSEFGTWGLPRPSAATAPGGAEPWWWRTGGAVGPAGIENRFREQGLDRIWADVDGLAEETQWRQLDALAAQVRELRRRPGIRGYVVTELADAAWEANGLLDFGRRPKAFHDRLAEINAPDVLLVDPAPGDEWGGEPRRWRVALAGSQDLAARPKDRGRLDWQVVVEHGPSVGGSVAFDAWPRDGVAEIVVIDARIPDVRASTIGELGLTAVADGSDARAAYRQDLVVVPRSARRSAEPRRIRVVDPLDLWSIAARLEGLGHETVSTGPADLVVTSRLDSGLAGELAQGVPVLLLARSDDAIVAELDSLMPIRVRNRRAGDGATPEDRALEGDWISTFTWAGPGVVAGLPAGGLLGPAHAEIFPDHVLDLSGNAHGVTVDAGMFAGWVRSPVAALVSFQHGPGRVTVTTMRVAPEDGPVATSLLERLVQRSCGPTPGSEAAIDGRPAPAVGALE
jgi:hypothetical protein